MGAGGVGHEPSSQWAHDLSLQCQVPRVLETAGWVPLVLRLVCLPPSPRRRAPWSGEGSTANIRRPAKAGKGGGAFAPLRSPPSEDRPSQSRAP
eukprot:scaffold1869_cov493-Prasinococcus_capsulatus_cf.AAC.9